MKPAVSSKVILWLSIAAFLSTVFVVIATKFGDILPYNLPFGSTEDLRSNASTISRIGAHQANIERKADIEPLWVLAGQVNIREESPRYWFGDIGSSDRTPAMYPLDKEGVQHGTVYMARGSRIERVDSLDQLVNRYRIYLTYYADTSKGEAIGIVKTVKVTKDEVVAELLEDPMSTQYRIPATLPLEAVDSSKLFDLKPGTPLDLKEGDIVKLVFAPDPKTTTALVTKIIREAPRIKLFFGRITKISRPDKDTLWLSLDSSEAEFTIDRNTLVYQTDELPPAGIENFRSRNLGFRPVSEGANVSLMVYIDADHWKVLTLAIRP